MITAMQRYFQLKPEDNRKLTLMGVVFLLAGISEMMNYTSFMAIFNTRVGIMILPIMYVVEACLLPIEGWLLSFFSQRLVKARFMSRLYLLFVAIGIINGIILLVFRLFEVEWIAFYFILFITSNFVIRQQTLLMWATAFDLCPTQQAKRLMPVFVLLAIIGGIIAGLTSTTLATLLGSELLYLIAAVLLLAAFPSFIHAIRKYLVPLTFQEEQAPQGERSSYYWSRLFRSPFLLLVVGIMTVMPALYFVMEYQYFTKAQQAFPNESELTSFYGMMVVLLFIAAFILQLISTKLMDKLGATNTILLISIIFVACFGLTSLFIDQSMALVMVAIGYSFTYLLLYYFAEPSYQFFFKMVPLQHRDGYRYTAQGIASSAGILLGSGISLLHSQWQVSLTLQAIIGLVLAAILVVIAWAAKSLYIKELIANLQQSTKDYIAELLESMRHERMRKAIVQQLQQGDVLLQQFTLELLIRQPDPTLYQVLWQYAEHGRGKLKALALSAIHPQSWQQVKLAQYKLLLRDEDAEVRAIGYHQLFLSPQVILGQMRDEYIDKARRDVSLLVNYEAWKVINDVNELQLELQQQLQKGNEAAELACQLIGERHLDSMIMDVMMCMLSESQAVKLTAVRVIGQIADKDMVTSLMELLVGADIELNKAIEEALLSLGESANEELLRFVASPNQEQWSKAVSVLSMIGKEHDVEATVIPTCMSKLQELSASHRMYEQIAATNQEQWIKLARERTTDIVKQQLDTIWKVMIRYSDERAVTLLREAVESDLEEIRDHGIEILSEGFGHSKLSSQLLNYYRGREVEQEERKEVTDPWLQAIAIKAGAEKGELLLMNNWEYLSALDKIVFLKQAPLFQDISLDELGRIASIAHERKYEEDDYLLQQGEQSTKLFIVLEGHVEISGMNEEGVEGTLAIISEKMSIGEASLFDLSPSRISAQVLFGQVHVLEISGDEVVKLVRLYPEIGVGLLRSISHRLHDLEQMLLKLG